MDTKNILQNSGKCVQTFGAAIERKKTLSLGFKYFTLCLWTFYQSHNDTEWLDTIIVKLLIVTVLSQLNDHW